MPNKIETIEKIKKDPDIPDDCIEQIDYLSLELAINVANTRIFRELYTASQDTIDLIEKSGKYYFLASRRALLESLIASYSRMTDQAVSHNNVARVSIFQLQYLISKKYGKSLSSTVKERLRSSREV